MRKQHEWLEKGEQKKQKSLNVSITIYDVPIELVKKFNKRVVEPFYPGDRGVSQAIRDLMRKAVREKE